MLETEEVDDDFFTPMSKLVAYNFIVMFMCYQED